VGRKIDAHLHLWDLSGGGYRWLTPEAGPLFATYTAEQAEAAMTTMDVREAVLVQADDTDEDTDAMLRIAAVHPWVRGVVGWLPLRSPERARLRLDELRQHPAFCGVRHLVHDDPDPDFLLDPAVHHSLTQLALVGVPFDVPDAWPRHLDQLTSVSRAIPGLTVVIDHLGKPPRGRPELREWRSALRRAAALPDTVAKVSGLWVPGADYTAEALREVWETALEAFGPDRLMWGSDWPVTHPEGGYSTSVGVLFELIGELSPSEGAEISFGTAARVYGLD
jgi:L-fuconolactonase